MSGRKLSKLDWMHGRGVCAYCGEVFVRKDKRATWKRIRRTTVWFCSDECKRRHEQKLKGESPDPYLGQALADGFALLHASEYPD